MWRSVPIPVNPRLVGTARGAPRGFKPSFAAPAPEIPSTTLPPTQPMLDYMIALARRLGVQITAEMQSSRKACRSEEHTSELQSLMRISYAVFCLKKKQHHQSHNN